LVPGVVLFAVEVVNLGSENFLLAALVPLGVAAIMVPIYGGIAVKARRQRQSETGGVLLMSFGRFRLRDALGFPPFAARLGSADQSRLMRGRGWIEGTITVTRKQLTFEPGGIAEGAAVPSMALDWESITSIQVIHQPMNLNVGVRLVSAMGDSIDIEIRSEKRVRTALYAVAQPAVP
jgi:hypothetical protein